MYNKCFQKHILLILSYLVLSCLANIQSKNSEFCAPLTSFDWNETDPNILGASSIDTTCTIWGLEVKGLVEGALSLLCWARGKGSG